MDLQLGGKVAIVTGASRGLGRAIAVALADEGARVLAVGRDPAGLRDLNALSPATIRTVVADMRDFDQVAALPAAALDAFDRLDVVVNNAGIAPARFVLDETQDQWQEVFDVNVFAPVVLAREAGRHLTDQGNGKVINIASTSGIRGKPSLVSYSASKGALIQFTTALAAEWARFGVQVNAIAPGAFETDAQRAVLESPELLKRRIGRIPAKRIAAPQEIGALACYLASPVSDFVTGAVYTIDGGEASKL